MKKLMTVLLGLSLSLGMVAASDDKHKDDKKHAEKGHDDKGHDDKGHDKKDHKNDKKH
jgi:hypothetical protein